MKWLKTQAERLLLTRESRKRETGFEEQENFHHFSNGKGGQSHEAVHVCLPFY